MKTILISALIVLAAAFAADHYQVEPYSQYAASMVPVPHSYNVGF